MSKIFRDKIALVTGAASGIGRATAIALGAEGATVFVVDLEEQGCVKKFNSPTTDGF